MLCLIDMQRTTARTVAMKMGIKPGSRAFFCNAPHSALMAMQLPNLELVYELMGSFDYLHLFISTRAEFILHFPLLKTHLNEKGKLWVSWPKNKQLGTDLSLGKVIDLGYSFGLVESTCLSINETWSALKFTHPIPGKSYQNSFGELYRPLGEHPRD